MTAVCADQRNASLRRTASRRSPRAKSDDADRYECADHASNFLHFSPQPPLLVGLFPPNATAPMLRALLRVSQRAVRIQLEHAHAPAADVPRRAAPVGGIPGFWVEKPRVQGQTVSVVGHETSPVSVKDIQHGIAVGADDGLPVSEAASSPDLQSQPATPATASSEPTPLGRENEANSLGEESPKAQGGQSNVGKALEAEEAKAGDVRTEEVKVQETEIEAVGTGSIRTESIKTEPIRTEPVRTEPVRTEPVRTDDIEREAVRTRPIEAEPVKTKPVETEQVEPEASKIEGQSALDADVPATETATPSVELDDVEQRPVRSRPWHCNPLLTSAQPQVVLRPSKVPSSRIGRLFHYGCKSFSPLPSTRRLTSVSPCCGHVHGRRRRSLAPFNGPGQPGQRVYE